MESTNGDLTKSSETFETLLKLLALLITSYPAILSLLEQFKEDFASGIHTITEALNSIREENGDPERLTRQLTEAIPELGKYIPKAYT